MFETISLFSYPVLKSNFGYVLNEKEYKKIDDLKLETKKHGAENIEQTKNSYVLDLKEFENLKKYIQNFINIYKKEILDIDDSIEIYITQSWLNWAKEKQFVHKHEHPNSFLSGVFYVDAKNVPTVFETKNRIWPLSIGSFKNYNMFNSDSYSIDVENNNLIIFPSMLPHHTKTVNSVKERITLAFNTFVKGNIGNEQGLYELKLK